MPFAGQVHGSHRLPQPQSVAMARSDAVLLWDPTNQTLIVGNIVGDGCLEPDPDE
jgi:hypothetical protein